MEKTERVYLSELSDLVGEFDTELNHPFTPQNFTRGSKKKVWWRCGKGHSWQAPVKDRTRSDGKSTGCPYCSGRKVGKDNNLQVINPNLSSEWHPNKNLPKTPMQFTAHSNSKVWWMCVNGHEWQAQISKRSQGRGCPYCTNQKVHQENNLETVAPYLVQEWDFEKNKTHPKEHVAGSGKKVWWQCDRGHSWRAVIYSRVNGTGCPKCATQSSRPELRIFAELKLVFQNIEHRHKFGKDEVDIYLPDLKLGIEYDGSYFHKNKHSHDLEKNKRLQSLGIDIIRVRVHPLKKIHSQDLILKKEPLEKTDIDKILLSLSHMSISERERSLISNYLLKKSFGSESLFREMLSDISNPAQGQSLSDTHPFLAKEWNFSKNNPLIPEQFSMGSHEKVWWECPKGHQWKSKIYSRTKTHRSKFGGCPYCSGWKVSKEINLQAIYPLLARQWHPTKNGNLTPDKVTVRNGKRFGGFVLRVMNGNIELVIELVKILMKIVHIVLEEGHQKRTTSRQANLNYSNSGTMKKMVI